MSEQQGETQPTGETRVRARSTPRPNTCGGCSAVWMAATYCHCGGCHETFSGVSLFDLHRSQEGEHGSCVDPEVLRIGGEELTYDVKGVWHGPAMPEARVAALRGLRADERHDTADLYYRG